MQVFLQHRVPRLKPDLSHSLRNAISKRKDKLRVLGSLLSATACSVSMYFRHFECNLFEKIDPNLTESFKTNKLPKLTFEYPSSKAIHLKQKKNGNSSWLLRCLS